MPHLVPHPRQVQPNTESSLLKACKKCGGLTVRLRGGLCSPCILNAVLASDDASVSVATNAIATRLWPEA